MDLQTAQYQHFHNSLSPRQAGVLPEALITAVASLADSALCPGAVAKPFDALALYWSSGASIAKFTTETHFPTALEARSLRSRCQKIWFLVRTLPGL